MKKHSIGKVVLITMIVCLVLTWIFPAAYYSGEYVDQGRVQMGLFDLFNYPLTALSYFGYIALFIILIGGFYGVLYKIPAYRSFLNKIVDKVEGKEKLFISIMIILIALLVSLCGLQFGVALLIPLIVSIILLMGYDKIVAAFVSVGGISAGLIGATYAYNNLSVLFETLNLKFGNQIGVRFVLLLLAIVVVIFNTLMYISNHEAVKIEKKPIKKYEDEDVSVEEEKIVEPVKKAPAKKNNSKTTSKSNKNNKSSSTKKTNNSSKSRSKNANKAALKDEDIIVVKESVEDEMLVPGEVRESHKTWPFTVGFFLLLVLLVLAFITWGDTGFKVTAFENSTKAVQEFKLFGFPLFGKILGTVNSFGNWTINDLCAPMFLALLLIVIIYKVKLSDILEGFAEGAKKALAPAAIVILVYSILVLVTYHPFQLTIYKAVLGWSKGFNIASTVIVAMLSSLFNVDVAYTYQSVLPYYVTIVTKSNNYPLVSIIFQTMYGLMALVAPTSVFLMTILSYLNVSYKEWLKNVWKLFVELFILLLITFIILAVI